jgi:Uma2 family endonuclease
VAAVARRPWTAEELDRLPQGWRYEIDEGELVIMTPAGHRHARLVARITSLLNSFVTEHHAGEVVSGEVGVYLQDEPETLRGVDIAFFSPERAGQIEDEIGCVRVPPDLAVEVHDPSEPDIRRKVEQYLRAGVRSVWVVEPEKSTLTLHRPAQEPLVLPEPDTLVQEPVLPGFSCRLGDLFGKG